MTRRLIVILALGPVLFGLCVPARADNCSGLTDCWENIVIAAVAVAALAALIFILLNPEIWPAIIPWIGEAGAAAGEVEGAAVAEAVEAGIPQDVAEALGEINPAGGTMNCGLCSAYGDEAIAGGPTFQAGLEAEVAEEAGFDAGLSSRALEQETGSFFSGSTPERITEQMLAGGPDSRGIVGVWNSAGEGHFFNVANFDGSVFALDFQSGSWYIGVEEAVADMGYGDWSQILFMPTGG